MLTYVFLKNPNEVGWIFLEKRDLHLIFLITDLSFPFPRDSFLPFVPIARPNAAGIFKKMIHNKDGSRTGILCLDKTSYFIMYQKISM